MCYDLVNLVNLVASTCWNADVGPMLATVSTVLSGRRPLFCCFSFMNGSKSSRTQGSSRFFSDFVGLDHWKVSTALICWFSQRCGEFSSDFPLNIKFSIGFETIAIHSHFFRVLLKSSQLSYFTMVKNCGCFSNRVNYPISPWLKIAFYFSWPA